MSTRDYHLQQAKRLREMAAQCAGTKVSKDWLKAADEHQRLADDMPSEDAGANRIPSASR